MPDRTADMGPKKTGEDDSSADGTAQARWSVTACQMTPPPGADTLGGEAGAAPSERPRQEAELPHVPSRARYATRWDGPYPEFAFSESRVRLRQGCARAYYYAVYVAHGRWAATPGSEARWAYRLKCATPLAAALGMVVHGAASHCVAQLRAGHAPPDVAVGG